MSKIEQYRKLYDKAWEEIQKDPMWGGPSHSELMHRVYEIVGDLLNIAEVTADESNHYREHIPLKIQEALNRTMIFKGLDNES